MHQQRLDELKQSLEKNNVEIDVKNDLALNLSRSSSSPRTKSILKSKSYVDTTYADSRKNSPLRIKNV